MATFVLIPGAGGLAWSHLLGPELEARGHAAVPIDLPAGDDGSGLAEYAELDHDGSAAEPTSCSSPVV